MNQPNDEVRILNDECPVGCLHSSSRRSLIRHSSFVIPPRAFTLFELILAIALSATLLGLIGTAINLYLLRVDAGRTRVEEAQLARSILAMIADDIRATTVYEPQDTSAIAQIIASSASQNDDSDDESEEDSNDSPTAGGTGGTGSTGAATFVAGSESSADDDGDPEEPSSASDDDEEFDDSLPLGLSGTLTELYVDVTRLPRRDELFGTITGYTNAPMPLSTNGTTSVSSATAAPGVTPSDLKTVRYFIRQGERVDPARIAATPLAPELQQSAGGLVRQEIARPLRTFAERNGNRALLELGQVLIAPEVVHLEFRYYDGEPVVDVWDMHEEDALPVAIEIRIWLVTPEEVGTADGSSYDANRLVATAREYRQTVSLPMSSVSGSGARGSMSSSGSSFDSSSSTSDSNGD
jgi:type II secretory pathway pseudopilin PulG